jgi:glutamine amidotransferase
MFMHNGGIGCWKQIKRRLAMSLDEKWFNVVGGSTDSEWAFATFLDCLDKAGISPDRDVEAGVGFGHTVLRKALLKTIERLNGFIKEVVGEQGGGVGEEDSRSLLNFAVTDGVSVVCSRYVSSRTDEAASLFFSSGTSWRELNGAPSQGSDAGASSVDDEERERDYVMERRDKGSDIVLVASEPLTFERGMLFSPPPSCSRAALTSNRQLGHCSNKQYSDHLQTNCHDSSYCR